jgi:CBS domain-containing protein
MSIMRVMESNQHQIITCTPQDSVRQAATLLADKRIGALPVMDGDQVVGIFSERDLLYSIAREGEATLGHSVGDVMTSPPITVDASVDALHALSLMTRRRVRHLPVVEDGRLLGFVSIGDLVKFRMDRIEAEAEQMRVYITMS